MLKCLIRLHLYILGIDTDVAPIRSLADVLGFLFELEKVSNLNFNIDVKKPPRSEEWECSISFKGKDLEADYNADMCLFLEEWENERQEVQSYTHSQATYRKWQIRPLHIMPLVV